VKGHKPADYLIRPIVQRRYCYSLTAGTGTGKTTVAMLLAAHVAIGRKINDDVTCKKGTVLYFAGENPDDCRTRWLGLTRNMEIDPATTDVHFIDGAMHLSKVKERITAEIEAKKLEPALIVVDTSMAFYEGDDPNNNKEQIEHARRMRSLCALPSGPCVLILCHPVKNASDDNIKPYGGGAFLNEIDGNIQLRKSADGKMVAAEADPGKFRGAQFSPISFELVTVWDHPEIVDSDGAPMSTVVARPISTGEAVRREEVGNKDDIAALNMLCDQGAKRQADVAKALDWLYRAGAKQGKPDDKRARTVLRRLLKKGYVTEDLGVWTATTKGQKAANNVDRAIPEGARQTLPPANLGSAAFPTPRMITPPPMPPETGK
jgi:AAA domain